jgi:hypothetical protein
MDIIIIWIRIIAPKIDEIPFFLLGIYYDTFMKF